MGIYIEDIYSKCHLNTAAMVEISVRHHEETVSIINKSALFLFLHQFRSFALN